MLKVPSKPKASQMISTDLWQNALAGLDKELRSSLDFSKASKHEILRKTLQTAEEKKQLCLSKRWKFERRGKEIVLRDVFEKIIKWVERFKAVGDVAVQYDPGHASLAWAGVRFLLQVSRPEKRQVICAYQLQVAVSDSHAFGSTIAGLETVSQLIARYSIFEDAYSKRNTAATAELESALTGLYAEILTFLAKSKKYFQTPTACEYLANPSGHRASLSNDRKLEC